MEKKIEKKRTKVEKSEIAFGMKLRLANKKNDYIRNIINGRYYLARYNMIARQLLPGGEILEKIDGALKTKEYVLSECGLVKMQAIMSLRNAHFAKQDLFKDHGLIKEDIVALEKNYYDGKIVRDSYDESYKKGKKAEFVDTSKD